MYTQIKALKKRNYLEVSGTMEEVVEQAKDAIIVR